MRQPTCKCRRCVNSDTSVNESIALSVVMSNWFLLPVWNSLTWKYFHPSEHLQQSAVKHRVNDLLGVKEAGVINILDLKRYNDISVELQTFWNVHWMARVVKWNMGCNVTCRCLSFSIYQWKSMCVCRRVICN